MATITLPNQPWSTIADTNIRDLRISRSASSFRSFSPYTFDQQVRVNPGRLLRVEFTLPPLTLTDADAWLDAMESLYTLENTFNLELGLWYAGYSTTAFRLAEPSYSVDIDMLVTYGMSIAAVEAV